MKQDKILKIDPRHQHTYTFSKVLVDIPIAEYLINSELKRIHKKRFFDEIYSLIKEKTHCESVDSYFGEFCKNCDSYMNKLFTRKNVETCNPITDRLSLICVEEDFVIYFLNSTLKLKQLLESTSINLDDSLFSLLNEFYFYFGIAVTRILARQKQKNKGVKPKLNAKDEVVFRGYVKKHLGDKESSKVKQREDAWSEMNGEYLDKLRRKKVEDFRTQRRYWREALIYLESEEKNKEFKERIKKYVCNVETLLKRLNQKSRLTTQEKKLKNYFELELVKAKSFLDGELPPG